MNVEPKFSSIQQVTGQYLHTNKITAIPEKEISFQEYFLKEQERVRELKFSKHADSRLAERNINLTANQLKRLEDGTEKARAKGIKESLVMVDQLAFIVNIKNRTVVTAMSQEESKEAIFTNIDGAVIV